MIGRVFVCKSLAAIIILWSPQRTNGQHSVLATDPHGRQIVVYLDERTGLGRGMNGFSEHIENYGLTKEKLNDKSVEELSRKLIADYKKALRLDLNSFKKADIHSAAGGWSITFQQSVGEVPIDGSEFQFGIGESGDIPNIVVKAYPEPSISTHPSFTVEQVLRKYSNPNAHVYLRLEKADVELVILPTEADQTIAYELAWKFFVREGTARTRYYISAVSGKVLKKDLIMVE